jgi:hypothetical protein
MKSMFSRVFSKKDARHQPVLPASSALTSELSTGDLENYYARIILDCLGRMMVPLGSIDVTVQRAERDPASGPDQLPAFAGFVRILKWDPLAMPVLLQNMPIIDGRIRKIASASVILEHTQFAGMWFQASSSTEGSPKALLGLPLEMTQRPRIGPVAAA